MKLSEECSRQSTASLREGQQEDGVAVHSGEGGRGGIRRGQSSSNVGTD